MYFSVIFGVACLIPVRLGSVGNLLLIFGLVGHSLSGLNGISLLGICFSFLVWLVSARQRLVR
jgi:hypothetical protein